MRLNKASPKAFLELNLIVWNKAGFFEIFETKSFRMGPNILKTSLLFMMIHWSKHATLLATSDMCV